MIAAIDMGAPPKKVSPAASKTYGASEKAQAKYIKSNVYKPHPDYSLVRQAAYGQWVQIHIAAGAKPYSNNHRHHAKCYCGGKDRMRVLPDYANTGRWYCSGGGDQQSGDGFSWLCHALNWTPSESLKFVADYLGLTKADDKELAAIRKKAAEQANKIAAEAAKKHEQARRDSNMLNMLEDLIDAIKHRQYLQREIIKTTGGFISMPTEAEINMVKELVTTCIDGYADYMGDNSHD